MNMVKYILNIVILVFGTIVVFILITSRTNRLGNIRSFVVLTGSMEPAIKTHALVFAKPANYQKNDVIVFQAKDKTIVHRVVDMIYKNGGVLYKTKGDANNVADTDLVSQHEVLGKVTVILLYVGEFILFLKTVPGFIMCIVMPAFAFIVLELSSIKKEIEIETEKRVLKKMNAI